MSGFKGDKNKNYYDGAIKEAETKTEKSSLELSKTVIAEDENITEKAEGKKKNVKSENVFEEDENKFAAEETVDDDVINFNAEDNEEDNSDTVVHLSKKMKYEDKIITKIDISRIKDLNAKDLKKVEKLYRKTTKNLSAAPETTLDYAIAMASYLTGMPVEFLSLMPAADSLKLKNRVINFLYED